MTSQLDIIERLNNDEMFIDAIDDAITEIEELRKLSSEYIQKYSALVDFYGQVSKCSACAGYYVPRYICSCGHDNSVENS